MSSPDVVYEPCSNAKDSFAGVRLMWTTLIWFTLEGGLRGQHCRPAWCRKEKLIKNNIHVILSITFAQTAALYPGVFFLFVLFFNILYVR